MHRHVSGRNETHQPGILASAVSSRNVALAIDSSLVIARKHLHILGVFDNYGVTVEGAVSGQSDLAVDLKSPATTFVKSYASSDLLESAHDVSKGTDS